MEPEHYLSDIKAMWWPYVWYTIAVSLIEYVLFRELFLFYVATVFWVLTFGSDTINYYKLYRKAKKQQLQAIKERL
jgi:hypothetical protein